MKNRTERRSVAPLAPSTWSDPSNPNAPSVPGVKILIPPELNARPDRPFVVNADNKAASATMLIVALVFDVFLGVALFLGFRYAGRLGAGAAFILAILAALVVAVLVLLLLSGDLPALFEVQKSEHTERRRIQAVERIGLAQTEVQKIYAQAQRTGERARLLEAQNEKAAIKAAMLVDHRQSMANQLQDYEAPEPYVPADPMPDPAYLAVLKFVGEKLFDNVDPQTGRIKVAVPWGKTGGLSASEAGRVAEWIDTINRKAQKGPVFIYQRQAWHVNLKAYPTAWLVSEELKRVPLLRAN